MFDAVSLGELLIDFTEYGKSPNGNTLYQRNAGGATANVMADLSAMGHQTAFIGKVGKDDCGKFLKNTLESYGINTHSLLLSKEAFTTLAFVSLDEKGERSFSFARNPGADTLLREDEVPEDMIKESKILHLGSLSTTAEPSKSATYKAIDIAKENHVLIAFDPNYRPSLWESKEKAVDAMIQITEKCDLMKATDEEAEMITKIGNPALAAQKLCQMGPKVVAITSGGNGCTICLKGQTAYVPTTKVTPVDTTGAGDAFWAGFLHRFLLLGKNISSLTTEDVVLFAEFGNEIAKKCIMKTGAMLRPCDIQ